jgi:hypothetical protein
LNDTNNKKVSKFVNKKINSDMFDDQEKLQDDYAIVNPNDVNVSVANNSYAGMS